MKYKACNFKGVSLLLLLLSNLLATAQFSSSLKTLCSAAGKIRIHFLITLLSLFIFSAQATPLIPFNIAEKSVDKALIDFAQQADKTILFSYELTKNHQANSIKGHYPAQFALKKLLRNTGLVAHIDQQGQIRVEVKSTTQQQIANSAVHPKQLDKNSEEPIEALSIIGSRVLGRSPADLPVPVDIISTERLELTGQNNLGKSLQVVAPSFNFPSSSISDGTDVLTPATLRGLGPDQTLVLINGKRRHQASLIHINTSVGKGTAGTDITAIPQNAIKKIEVLRDGAAAQYGSDAIAGVINIVLKDSSTKGDVSLTYGQYSRDDGQNLSLKINKGFSLFEQGFINTSLLVTSAQATNRAGQDGKCIYSGCIEISPNIFETSNPQELSASRDTFVIGEPESKQVALVVNSEVKLNHNDNLYSFITLSKRDNITSAFFRNANTAGSNPILADGEAFNPDGFLPEIHSEIEDFSYNVGYKNQLTSDTFIDISYTHGQNTIDYETHNSVNPSFINYQENTTSLTANELRNSVSSSAYAYGLSLSLKTLNIDFQHSFSWLTLSLGGELRQDQYQVTPGEEYAYKDYDSKGSSVHFIENYNGGIEGFGGINKKSAVNEKRNVQSLYIDIDTSPFDSLNISSALRYDHDQYYGSTTNIKLAALWQPSDDWSVRSAYSTGFRAPSMQQLFTSSVSTQFGNFNPTMVNQQPRKVGTFGSNSVIGQEIGLPKLTEERSKNFSFGSTINITEQLNLTVDYYSTHIDDRILFTKKIICAPDSQLNDILSEVGAQAAQFFINGADTHTTGIDIITTWQNQLLGGQFELTLAANKSTTKIKSLYAPTLPVLNKSLVGELISEQDISIIEEWQPQDKVHLNALFSKNDWAINLSVNRYGKYTIIDGGKQEFSPKVLTDINIQYKINADFTLTIGGNNVFDAMPDKNTIGNSHSGTIVDSTGNEIVNSNGVFDYSRRSAPFGFNGAYFYSGINYAF